LPSQGKLFVRADSKIFRFQNGKTESLFLQRKNPRRIAWTVLCRRQRRKGISEVRTNAPIPSTPQFIQGVQESVTRVTMLTPTIGASQDSPSPPSQVTARRCRCLA